MAKFRFLQNSFRSGELGDKLIARVDSQQYQEACDEVLNMVPIKQGGLTKRRGSKFNYLINSRPAIIPFIFSQDEGYAILINHDGSDPAVIDQEGVLRIVRLSTQSMNKTLDDWSWAVDLDPNGWQYTQSGDVLILVHSSGTVPPILVKRERTGQSGYDPTETLFNFQWYLDEEEPPGYSTVDPRTKVLRWTYQATNIKDIWFKFTMIGGGPTYTSCTITAYKDQAATTPITDFWHEDQRRSLIRVTPYETSKPNNVEYVFEINNVVGSPTHESANCSLVARGDLDDPFTMPDISAATFNTKDWRKSYWSDRDGWPRTVTQFEQRLFFGGNAQFPDNIWASKSANIFHMMRQRLEQDKNITEKKDDISGLDYFGVETPSDPMDVAIASSEVNKIQWLYGSAALYVGTVGSLYMLSSADSTGLSNDSVRFFKHSSVGGSDVMPGNIDRQTYFVSRSDRKLYSATPADEFNTQVRDINILNEDIVSHNSDKTERIERLAAQQSSNTVWALTSNNELIGFTESSAEQIAGWHRHTFGSSSDIDVISIGVIPNGEGTYDDLWVAVQRKGVGLNILTDTYADDSASPPVDNGTGFGISWQRAFGHLGTQLMPGRASIRIPDNVNVSALTGDIWFSVFSDTDASEYAYFFDNTVGQTAAVPPSLTGNVPIRVNTYQITDADGLIQAIVDATDATTSDIEAMNGYVTIETVGRPFDNTVMYDDSFLDNEKPYLLDSSAINTEASEEYIHAGFDHLIGETVHVIADGFYVGTKVVQSFRRIGPGDAGDPGGTGASGLIGYIELDNPAKEVIVGYSYTSRLKTFPIEAGSDFGTSIGAIQRIDTIHAILHRSFGLTAGQDDILYDLELIPSDYTLGSQIPLFTGRYKLELPSSPDDEQNVIMESTKPYPMTVLGIAIRGMTYDRSQ